MSDELKTIKFQLMLSPTEAEEIDDWGFVNRIRTRAEAMRRLCKIGIEFDRFSNELLLQNGRFLKEASEWAIADYEALDGEEAARVAVAKFVSLSRGGPDIQHKLLFHAFQLSKSINALMEITGPLKSDKDFEKAVESSFRVKIAPFLGSLPDGDTSPEGDGEKDA